MSDESPGDNGRGRHDERMIHRRQLLQAAALGIAGGAVGLGKGSADATTATASSGMDVTEAPLRAVGQGWLDLERTDGPSRFLISPGTSFWRGGEVSLSSLREGDDVMVRFDVRSGLALRAWANLTRAKGRVLDFSSDKLIIQSGEPHKSESEIPILVRPAAIFETGSLQDLSAGNYVDVIGSALDETVQATRIFATRGPVRPPSRRPGPDSRRPVDLGNGLLVCECDYSGHATWFDCGNGAGACATCSTSNSNQCAWPAMGTGCSCCSTSCCDCSRGCMDQELKSCGNQVSVYDQCSSNSRGVFIADCGPCQKSNCGSCSPEVCNLQCTNCSGDFSPVVIDLTKPTFATFYNPDTIRCFDCLVTTTCLC